jgi:hypothetical protein
MSCHNTDEPEYGGDNTNRNFCFIIRAFLNVIRLMPQQRAGLKPIDKMEKNKNYIDSLATYMDKNY